MEQNKDLQEQHATGSPNEQRAIGYIEGRLEGLATKVFVRDAINEQTRQLTDEINGIRDRQTKTIGVAVGIGFVLSLVIGAGNLAAQLGWIQTAPQ